MTIIEKICFDTFGEWYVVPEPTERDRVRDEAFKALNKTLNEEQRKLFDEYCAAENFVQAFDSARVFAQGIKTGFWIGADLMNVPFDGK